MARPHRRDVAAGDDALAAAIGALRDGAVVAVKGIGGYHLAVDATNAAAVRRAAPTQGARRQAVRGDGAGSRAAPSRCASSTTDAVGRARRRRAVRWCCAPRPAPTRRGARRRPGLPELGVFLPYSPLHHLLLAGVGRPLVMTSGNLSDEPIAHDDADAVAPPRSAGGRPAHPRPADPHPLRRLRRPVTARRPSRLLRRSRGYGAASRIALPFAAPAHRPGGRRRAEEHGRGDHGGEVVASHHIGDLEHLATYRSFVQAIDHLAALYDVTPEVVAHDLHPEYLSTKFAQELDLPLVAVQHHHAHVASCMVDHGRTEPVLGLAFDGLGYGTDGALWGGEVLVAGFDGFERVGHLRPVVMPGGVAAIREPWRMAVAWAAAAGVECVGRRRRDAATVTRSRRGRARAGPVTTSVGRLLDAVAAVSGRHRGPPRGPGGDRARGAGAARCAADGCVWDT